MFHWTRTNVRNSINIFFHTTISNFCLHVLDGEPALPVSVKTGQSVATQTPGVAASESESEVQPELEAEAGSEPEAEAELQAETESELEAEAEVEAETESELEAEAEVESEPKLEAVETGDESTPPGQGW